MPRQKLSFSVREVDGVECHDEIVALHEACFQREAPNVTEYDTLVGHWWIATHDGEPAAFCGVKESASEPEALYLVRSGVLPDYRGHGLQLRMIRVRERWARRNGWAALRTDTTSNPASANNLIKAGFRIFMPDLLWGFAHTIYWRKDLS